MLAHSAAAAFFELEADLVPPPKGAQLELQLSVAGKTRGEELSRLDGAVDGTARLGFVLAVGKTASQRDLLNVRKRFTHTFRSLPQLQLAHPRRIDDEPAQGEANQLAADRRVAALVVAGPDRLHGLKLVPAQMIDKGGF